MFPPSRHGWFTAVADRIRGRALWVFPLLLLLLLAPGSFRPVSAQEGPVATPEVCRIGVNIESLYDLDMARDTFGAILWVWSLCPSDELAPLNTIEFPSASAGLNLGPIEMLALPSGGQYTSRRVQGTFRHNWDMTHYPFDRQHVVIPMDETLYSAGRVTFEADERESFLTPGIREMLDEWLVSELTLGTSVSEEPSNYGLPDADGARYARLDVGFTLERTKVLTFVKLTSGVFAGVFIAFLSFFYDRNDRGGFGSKLGLLVGVLFAVLLNLRTADANLGHAGHLTLITKIHLVTLGLIIVLALMALRDRRRIEIGLPHNHTDWPGLIIIGFSYVAIITGMITAAALS